MCAGEGDLSFGQGVTAMHCDACRGLGTVRVNHDVDVIQLGDLGDFRLASQSADSMCWLAADIWGLTVLIGNHEAPVFFGPSFGGYSNPLVETKHRMQLMKHEGRLKLADASHGFLITHAGLGLVMKGMHTGSLYRRDPDAVATWINRKHRENPWKFSPAWGEFELIRDSIPRIRGGWSPHGGLLWRQANEPLYPGLRQIFGHSSDKIVGIIDDSYCLDTSKHGGLSALWLPSERIVQVREDELLDIRLDTE
jgi:hypothetical protein